ncbi:MAG: dipeptidase, partial [Bacteroidales bacterium]
MRYCSFVVKIGLMFSLVVVISCREGERLTGVDRKAGKIHERILTLDTHADTPLELDQIDLRGGNVSDERIGNVDFPRMKKGGLDAVFFAVYISQGPRNKKEYELAREKVLGIFREIHFALERNTDLAELALTSSDAGRIEKLGKRAVYIGIENGYAIGIDLTLLKTYYDLGARYITLCHSGNNDICDSSTDNNGPEHNGLSDFGKQVIKEMNRLGIIIDVSHISDEAFNDVIEASKAPVIASHSCTRELCGHPRNLSDDMLLKLKENEGVVQITLVSSFVKTRKDADEIAAAYDSLIIKYGDPDTLDPARLENFREAYNEIRGKYPRIYATVADLVDHIDHVVELIGVDHVGIGSDFDGGGGLTD